MSPEQVEGRPVDARSDIFSFGAVFYEMLTGQGAFRRDTKASTIAALLGQEPKAARELVEGIPADVERILRRSLRKDRAQRVQHMIDLQLALEELKNESESGTLAGIPVPPRTRKWRWLVPALLFLALGVIATAWIWLKGSPRSVGPVLTRLTSDPGLTTEPALSPDGRLVVYAPTAAGKGTWICGCNRSSAASQSVSPTTPPMSMSRNSRHPTRKSPFAPSAQAAAFI
jgi:serine/threonine protein kinase